LGFQVSKPVAFGDISPAAARTVLLQTLRDMHRPWDRH
jgi:hypothetical protein